MIDEDQQAIRALSDSLGLRQVRILGSGFAFAKSEARGRVKLQSATATRGFTRIAHELRHLSQRYEWSERRWNSPVAAEMSRCSVAQWLEHIGADAELRAAATGLRGFLMADPEDLSLLAVVDQCSAWTGSRVPRMYRIEGGNDRLAAVLATQLGDRLHLNTELLAVSQRGGTIRVSLRNGRTRSQMQVDAVVFAMPATLLRRIPITPALPVQQHEAIASLHYGRATKTLLQFSTRFWRKPGRARAFGSALPIGAGWEANEDQRGKAGILALLAGGSASDATAQIVDREGVDGVVHALDWLGSNTASLLAWRQARWESDPWSRGAYAVFDPSFPPHLRDWLSLPCGQLFFAGEHTSHRWQGYMNGAVESGHRAAAEVRAFHTLSR